MATVNKFLLKNLNCVRVVDRKGNMPLHVACLLGAALDTICHLVIVYPEAMFLQNHSGETPLKVAHQSMRCLEEVATYL